MSLSRGYIDRFKSYDCLNPVIWMTFEEMCLESVVGRQRRFSAKAIMERIRWSTCIQTIGEYKITDTWTAFYLRKFLLKYPRYGGFFSLKSSYADDMIREDFDENWNPKRVIMYTPNEIDTWGGR